MNKWTITVQKQRFLAQIDHFLSIFNGFSCFWPIFNGFWSSLVIFNGNWPKFNEIWPNLSISTKKCFSAASDVLTKDLLNNFVDLFLKWLNVKFYNQGRGGGNGPASVPRRRRPRTAETLLPEWTIPRRIPSVPSNGSMWWYHLTNRFAQNRLQAARGNKY